VSDSLEGQEEHSPCILVLLDRLLEWLRGRGEDTPQLLMLIENLQEDWNESSYQEMMAVLLEKLELLKTKNLQQEIEIKQLEFRTQRLRSEEVLLKLKLVMQNSKFAASVRDLNRTCKKRKLRDK